MGFYVKWLMSLVSTLKDLRKVGPSTYASLSLVQQLKVKKASQAIKVEEARSAPKAHGVLVTRLQEFISKLQKDLTSKLEAGSILQAQLNGIEEEQGSLIKEIEKLERELGALSHLDFSFENVNTLTIII